MADVQTSELGATFELLDEILYLGDDIEYYFNSIQFNPIASTMADGYISEVCAIFEPIGGFG
jgi:hypothetical protein